MNSRYEMVIYWNEEDQRYIAEWLETARELGRPIPQPHGKLMYA